MHQARAATAEDLDKTPAGLADALQNRTSSERLSRTAKAVLVFPNMVKCLVFGGSYGAKLLKGSKVIDYYNSVTGSWVCRSVRSRTDTPCFDDRCAVRYVEDTKGWEIGVGPTVVWLTKGSQRIFDILLQDDAYASFSVSKD